MGLPVYLVLKEKLVSVLYWRWQPNRGFIIPDSLRKSPQAIYQLPQNDEDVQRLFILFALSFMRGEG